MISAELRDHYVVCGWGAQGTRMVQDLLSLHPPPQIIIICRRPIDEVVELPEHSHVTFVHGDPTHTSVLTRANAGAARAIVILGDAIEGDRLQTVDARTTLTALAIRQISPTVPLLAELRSEDNLAVARDAGVDEWILADHFSGAMLSQSIQSPGLSELFTRLFETGAGYALREEMVPPELVDQPFSRAIARTRPLGLGALAGLHRDDVIYLPPQEDLILKADDRLLLMQRMAPRS